MSRSACVDGHFLGGDRSYATVPSGILRMQSCSAVMDKRAMYRLLVDGLGRKQPGDSPRHVSQAIADCEESEDACRVNGT